MNDRYIKTSNLSHLNDLYEKTLNKSIPENIEKPIMTIRTLI